ncbi:hypothetical protein H5410_000904 [Solanum commersonii]|uniref:Uncharacterized protein n=1 Tax=Solanum commersonii TaxID=4109 RepID=A0A9J6AY81_SOLCO|nr:hypothetical protein H5410_000904 [Solanum commersonii]
MISLYKNNLGQSGRGGCKEWESTFENQFVLMSGRSTTKIIHLCSLTLKGSQQNLEESSLKMLGDEVSRCMLVVDNIVLINNKTCSEVNVRLEVRRQTLGSKGFRLSKTKIELWSANLVKPCMRQTWK